MTFLPIVERELRVAARRRGTYWLRFFTALGALSLFLLISAQSDIPGSLKASIIFHVLSGMMMFICLFSGVFSTADCLSSEKREGTMGLLFLTDLRGFDVVLGKLSANSLHTFYALLSALPILALPLMMGGVNPNEFWRMVLVLVSSLFLSLGIGMFISSVTRESRPAFLLTLLAIIALTLLLPLAFSIAAYYIPKLHSLTWLLWPSPVYAFRFAFDSAFTWGVGHQEYWGAVATMFSVGLACLALASVIIPRAWQEKSAGSTSRKRVGLWKRWRFGSAEGRPALRLRLLERNPFLWLTARDRLPKMMMWGIYCLVLPFWGLLCYKAMRSSGFMAFSFVQPLMFIIGALNLAFKFLVASESSRRLNEDRQSGALELLLVTPATVDGILTGQRRALENHFRTALLINLLLLGCLFWMFEAFRPNGMRDDGIFATLIIGNAIVLVSDFLAIGWLGMWDGLRARQHHRAILRTLIKVLLVPWIMWIVMMAMFASSFRGPGAVQTLFTFWFGICVVNNLFWSQRARSGLLNYFRLLVSDAATGIVRSRAPVRRISPFP